MSESAVPPLKLPDPLGVYQLSPEDAYFIDNIDDLRRLSGFRITDYSITQLASVLRRLLLDSRPLWVRANSRHHLDIKIAHVMGWQLRTGESDTRPNYMVSGYHLDPEVAQTICPEYLAPDPLRSRPQDFLQERIALSNGHPLNDEGRVTIAELIRYFAHNAGGVHYDGRPPSDPFFAALVAADLRSLQLTLLAVGRVVYRALEPLALQIATDETGWLDARPNSS